MKANSNVNVAQCLLRTRADRQLVKHTDEHRNQEMTQSLEGNEKKNKFRNCLEFTKYVSFFRFYL